MKNSILAMADVLQDVADFVNKCLGPLGSDGFQWSHIRDFLIQLVATLILFIFVKIFLWKPITEIIETRRDAIDLELAEAKESNSVARKYAAELQEKLDTAQQEIKAMIENAENTANVRKEKIINDAKEEAKKRLENVQLEIEQEIAKQKNEIHQTIVDIAFLAAAKIVSKDVNQEEYLTIVNDIIEGEFK